MKVFVKIAVLLLTASVFTVSCASTPQTTRVSSGKITDLDGNWNDTDVDIVCKDLINQFFESPRVANFEKTNKRLPVIKVSLFKNASNEPIDTTIISKRMQVVILNSGKADFVADDSVSETLRNEARDQQSNASAKTAARLADETGADFLLTGKVTSIVQAAGNKQVRAYDVSADATDISSHRIIWSGQNTEIKKVIKRPKTKI
ncbi:MAG: hypothetical protein Ta2B_03290 [Termitinemataceae bacterium]|nr:MAG: hypothetical protein Ta2B_03290 [Termitinemataceae bacterium]